MDPNQEVSLLQKGKPSGGRCNPLQLASAAGMHASKGSWPEGDRQWETGTDAVFATKQDLDFSESTNPM